MICSSELTKNLQFGAKTIIQNFHLSRRVSDENRACSIYIRFYKITDLFDGRSFLMCSHDPFFGGNKNRILKNRSCKQALRNNFSAVLWVSFLNCNSYSNLFERSSTLPIAVIEVPAGRTAFC